jgi:hypothetical protein
MNQIALNNILGVNIPTPYVKNVLMKASYQPLETGEALDVISVKLRGNVIEFAEWQNYISEQLKEINIKNQQN